MASRCRPRPLPGVPWISAVVFLFLYSTAPLAATSSSCCYYSVERLRSSTVSSATPQGPPSLSSSLRLSLQPTWPILLPPPASNVPCLRHRWETGILAGDSDDARTRGCHVACRDRPWAGDDSGHGPGGVRRGPSRTPVMPPLQRQSGALPLSTGDPLSLCPMSVCHI